MRERLISYERSPNLRVNSLNSSKTLGYMAYEATSVSVIDEPNFSVRAVSSGEICQLRRFNKRERKESIDSLFLAPAKS